MITAIVQLITWLAGLLSGWFISQFDASWWVSNRLWGPTLHLDVKQGEGSDITVPVADEDGQPKGRYGRYFRIEVQNSGWRQATGVIGLLVEIRKFDSAKQLYVQIGYHDTLPLTWSYRESEQIALSRGMRQFLDVVCVLRAGENGAALGAPRLAVGFSPYAYRDIVSAGGKYLFWIIVQAEQHVQKEIGMILEWDGNANLNNISVRPRFSRGHDAE